MALSREDLRRIDESYKQLFIRDDNKAALHLVQQMYRMHDDLLRKAQKSNDPDEAFGLLKEAGGIIKVLDHIKTKTGVELRRD